MNATAIADYESISNTSWSSGATGNVTNSGGTIANTSMHSIYYYYTTPNMRTTGKEFLMAPIRWSIAAPATNFGSYHFWKAFTSVTSARAAVVGLGYLQLYLGKMGITNTLLPTGSHAVWQGAFSQVKSLLAWNPVGNKVQNNFTEFNLTNFQAFNPTYEIWNNRAGIVGGVDALGWRSLYAIRHRVNGAAVGDLILNPPPSGNEGPEWRCDIAYGDTYELDVWYKLKSSASLANPSAPGKACVYFPTTLVHNGDRYGDYVPVQQCNFANIDFSPAFNYQEQTYQVSVAGHVGWTLKDGSNGPHKMITSGDWKATISNGMVVWEKTTNNDFVRAIVIKWDREIAHVELFRGPLMDNGISVGAVMYRVSDGNTVYRSSTLGTVADGMITHATPGLFTQAGTSVFTLVPWTYANSFNLPGSETQAAEGKRSGALSSFADLPTTITVTRVNQ